jgi:uncharacterized lipoprotein YbaY
VLGEYTLERAEQLEAHPFTIEYAADQAPETGRYVVDVRLEESSTGRLLAVSREPVAVISGGAPSERVQITLVDAPKDDQASQVSGLVMAAPGSADPLGDVLITVTLVDASEGADGAELGQATAGPFSRLRPPRDFALTFDPAAITSDGTYVLEARMEDSASGALLGTEAEQVPVITGGNPVEGITITIVDIAE